jgi:hypothetical protein
VQGRAQGTQSRGVRGTRAACRNIQTQTETNW